MRGKYIGLALLAAGFVAGILVAPGFRKAVTGAGGSEAPPDARNERERTERSGADGAATASGPIGGLLDKAFSEQSEIRANRHLMQALSQHRKETAPAFAAYFTAIPFSTGHFNHWRLFFSSWGTFDGPAALAYIRNRFDQPALQREFYYSVLKSWNREMPGEALRDAGDFLVATPGTAGDLAKEFVRDLMVSDPKNGISQMVRLSDPEAVMEMAGHQLAQLTKKDVRTALERLSGAEGESKLFLTGQLLAAWSETDPVGAANWLAENGFPVISPGDLNVVAANYVKVNAAAAFKWVNALPDTLFSEQLLEMTSAAWTKIDPAGATAWLSKLKPAPEYDPVVVALVQTIAGENPAGALAAANAKIHDAAKAQETFFSLAMEWKEKQPEEFAKWLAETNLVAAEQKGRLRNREFHADAESGQASVPARPQERISNGRE